MNQTQSSSYSTATLSPSVRTQPLSEVKTEIFGLSAAGTLNPVSSKQHHAQRGSFAVVPRHPFTHEAPERGGDAALPTLSGRLPQTFTCNRNVQAAFTVQTVLWGCIMLSHSGALFAEFAQMLLRASHRS